MGTCEWCAEPLKKHANHQKYHKECAKEAQLLRIKEITREERKASRLILDLKIRRCLGHEFGWCDKKTLPGRWFCGACAKRRDGLVRAGIGP